MEELLNAYEELYGKRPTGRWAKDQDWLAQKVAAKQGVEEFKASQSEEEAPAPIEKKGIGIAVVKLKGQVVREYREDRHGKDYRKLAESFTSQYDNYHIEDQVELS